MPYEEATAVWEICEDGDVRTWIPLVVSFPWVFWFLKRAVFIIEIDTFGDSRLTFGGLFGVFRSPNIVAYQRAVENTIIFTSHSPLPFVNVAQPKKAAEHERMKLPLKFMNVYIFVYF